MLVLAHRLTPPCIGGALRGSRLAGRRSERAKVPGRVRGKPKSAGSLVASSFLLRVRGKPTTTGTEVRNLKANQHLVRVFFSIPLCGEIAEKKYISGP